MMHPAGEIGAARAAQRHGLPYTLSTMATTTIEAVAEAAQPDLWFQLYILRDRGLTKELVDRAAAAEYRVLVVTVDTLRDRAPDQGPAQRADHPARAHHAARWPASRPSRVTGSGCCAARPSTSPTSPGSDAVTIEGTGHAVQPDLDWDDIAALRARWPGKLILKGPLSPADARARRLGWGPTACSCPTTAGASSTGRCPRST